MSEAATATDLATRVVDRIQADISERGLRPGDLVTTEVDLAAEMGISRNAAAMLLKRAGKALRRTMSGPCKTEWLYDGSA